MLALINFAALIMGMLLGLPIAWKIGSFCFGLLPLHVQSDLSWVGVPQFIQQLLPYSVVALVLVVATYFVSSIAWKPGKVLQQLFDYLGGLAWEFKTGVMLGVTFFGFIAVCLNCLLFLLLTVPPYIERIIGTTAKWLYIVVLILAIRSLGREPRASAHPRKQR